MADTDISVTAPTAGFTTLPPDFFSTPDAVTGFAQVNSTQLADADLSLGVSGGFSPVGGTTASSGGIGASLGGNTFGLLGQGIQDLFGASGDAAEAKAYGQAASLALQNEQLAKESTALQQTAAARQVYQTIGAQKAQVAGAGFSSSGTNQDLLRSSAQQGELTKQVLGVQGLVTENGYASQAAAYQGQEAAAKAAESGGIFGGILNIGASIASIF